MLIRQEYRPEQNFHKSTVLAYISYETVRETSLLRDIRIGALLDFCIYIVGSGMFYGCGGLV